MDRLSVKWACVLVRRFFAVLALITTPTFAAAPYQYARLKSLDVHPAGGPLVPAGGLIEGRDGALYGTSTSGGAVGLGTVFTLKKDGSGCRALHSFGDHLHFGIDAGATPKAGVVEASDGALYGTTSSGGRHKRGTIFSMNKDGSKYRLLHAFSGNLDDGANPMAALIEGTDGALYGTTAAGGQVGPGTIYRFTKDGKSYRLLRSFTGSSGDGASPQAALLEGKDGALYGTTISGGSPNRGTIFKINKDGTGYTVLYRFTGFGKEGANPVGSLLEGADGNLYGTTSSGGAGLLGTVFKIKKDGTDHTLLHSFTGPRANPESALIQAKDGALYGTTPFGGSVSLGSVFKLKNDGKDFQVIHSFAASPGEARGPRAALLQATDGAIYGTTTEGGDANQGAIFKIRIP